MASIKFNLKDTRAKKTSIRIILRSKGEGVKRLGARITVEVSKWDSNKQRLKINKALNQAEQRDNKRLQDIEDFFEKHQHESLYKLASLIKEYISTGTVQETKTLQDGFYLYMKSPNLKAGTIKTYERTRVLLQNFENPYLNDIDIEFYYRFIDFCESKGHSFNYLNSHVKNIKAVLNETRKRGLHKNHAQEHFKVKSEEVHNIYLSEEEIHKILEVELDGQKELIRDYFVLGCYTGLRYSDFEKIIPKSIKKVETKSGKVARILTVKTTKTGETVKVPLNETAISILEKYGKMPKAPADQLFNRGLKSIAEKAGIEGQELCAYTKGGKQVEEVISRSEMVKTHTARRSFATNAFKAGVQAISIMKITGHRTEKAFLNYIKVSKQENAELMAEHPFFS